MTPGPWKIIRDGNGATRIGPSHNHTVAIVLNPPDGQWHGNARLIAAAPEMYEVLEAAGVDLDLLLMAIKAGDPARELEIRASDIKRRLSAALSRVKG